MVRFIGIYCWLITWWAAAMAQQPAYRHYSIEHGLPTIQTYNALQDKAGFMWFTTAAGVCRFDGQTFTTYAQPHLLPAPINAALTPADKEELWLPLTLPNAAISYQNARYNKQQDTALQRLLPNQKQYFRQPVSCTLLETATTNKTLWIGTWGGGAYRCTGYQTPQLAVRSFLPQKTITAIFKDREGNYWFCTLDDGIYLLSQPDVLTYTTQHGLPANDLYAISGLPNGSVWVGTGKGSAAFLPVGSTQWQVFANHASEDAFNRVNQLLTTQPNQVWLATDAGLALLNPHTNLWFWVNLTPTTSLAPALNNQIWVGKHQYPTQFNTQTGAETTILPIQRPITALCLQAHNDTTLWVGTSAGLYRHHNGKTYYLANQSPKLALPITHLQTDTQNRLWIATADSGVLVKNNNQLLHFTTQNGLTANACNALFADAANRIWVATAKGLNCITLNHMNPQSAHITTYTTLNGLASDFVHDVWVHADSVWAATEKGLTLLPAPLPDVAAPQPAAILPPVYITAFKVWNQTLPSGKMYRLAYNQNNLTIEFIGLSYRSAQHIKYVYQMENADPTWLHTAARQVQYPALPPGKYLFKVAATDNWGAISNPVAVITIYISPPFWQTGYFRALLLLLCSAAIMAAIMGILGYYRRQNEFRRRVVESEQMALRAQMNPHFIFNSLNAIQYFITQNDKVSANRYLSVFATLIRKVLSYSKKPYISLEEEMEYIELYLQIESLRFQGKFTYRLHTHPNLTPHATGIPPMLIQPYVENAIQHGLLRKTDGEPLLTIYFEQQQPDLLLCTITDNGIGRARSKELTQGRQNSGIGTVNPKERLAILNQLLQKPIHVTITDIYANAGEPAGTEVKLFIPIYFD